MFSLHIVDEHVSQKNQGSSSSLEINQEQLDEPEFAPFENNATGLTQFVKVNATPKKMTKNGQNVDQWLYWAAHFVLLCTDGL